MTDVSAGAPMTQVLTKQDLPAILKLIGNFESKWNEIGEGLGFTQPELNQIRSYAPCCWAKLLSEWVQWPTVNHSKQPTLETLCEVLRSSPVGLGSLAEVVEREMKRSANGKGACRLHTEGMDCFLVG